jgi:hypothetical protein
MNNDSKIHLSSSEMDLVLNADWLLTKNSIIGKVYGIFGEVAERVRGDLGPSPKIARGENYQGLPWVMLDYPRMFGKEDTFAVRTFFWWGHFFSITLHLKGSYLQQYRQRILDHLSLLEKNDFHIGVSEEEWRHEFTADNYAAVKELGQERVKEMLGAARFCKLSVKISLEEWSSVNNILYAMYEVIYSITGHQLPSR